MRQQIGLLGLGLRRCAGVRRGPGLDGRFANGTRQVRGRRRAGTGSDLAPARCRIWAGRHPTPDPNSVRWLLEVTATAAPADPSAFEQQRQLLLSVAQFDAASQTWWRHIGALDVRTGTR